MCWFSAFHASLNLKVEALRSVHLVDLHGPFRFLVVLIDPAIPTQSGQSSLKPFCLKPSEAPWRKPLVCEYKILRFLDSDDFAGIKFCDFAQPKVKAQL